MRAAVFKGVGQPLVIETRPDPVPESDEVVLRVGRCGVCGTDLTMTDGSGQVYELNACLDFHLLERMRIRFGYQALWAVGVSTPATQFSFDLSNQGFRKADQGSAFWHGPIAELQFLW